MNKAYFLKTDRIGFSKWCDEDLPLAKLLWGDPKVTRYICASGSFSQSDIENRLQHELENEKLFGIQYWPIFERTSGELIGCCGLRPRGEKQYELGFHLRPQFWGQGIAVEAAKAVIVYAFDISDFFSIQVHAEDTFSIGGYIQYSIMFLYIKDYTVLEE